MAEGSITGEVELFPGLNGWHYVRVAPELAEALHAEAERRWPRVSVSVGKTTWETALLPLGDGTDFVAIKKSVRQSERISFGDIVELRIRSA